jgi:hypothetical protein
MSSTDIVDTTSPDLASAPPEEVLDAHPPRDPTPHAEHEAQDDLALADLTSNPTADSAPVDAESAPAEAESTSEAQETASKTAKLDKSTTAKGKLTSSVNKSAAPKANGGPTVVNRVSTLSV